jgi:hypothetical protein
MTSRPARCGRRSSTRMSGLRSHLAEIDARQSQPVLARRTHQPLVCRSSHDTLPAALYPIDAGSLQARRLRTEISKTGPIVGTARQEVASMGLPKPPAYPARVSKNQGGTARTTLCRICQQLRGRSARIRAPPKLLRWVSITQSRCIKASIFFVCLLYLFDGYRSTLITLHADGSLDPAGARNDGRAKGHQNAKPAELEWRDS